MKKYIIESHFHLQLRAYRLSSNHLSSFSFPFFWLFFLYCSIFILGSTEASGNTCSDPSTSTAETCAVAGEAASSPAAPAPPPGTGGSSSSSGNGGGGSCPGRMASASSTAEPVLSLLYSTEGTTTSTIKLDFTDEWWGSTHTITLFHHLFTRNLCVALYTKLLK